MAERLPIPVYTNLHDLHHNLRTSLDQSARWSNLAQEFVKRFGRKPAYIARAPGRVNLIGEHIDYALFGVFPAAIERDILIACAPRTIPARLQEPEPGSVVAENLHSKYTKQVFAPVALPKKQTSEGRVSDGSETVHVEEWHLDIDTKQLRWESYVKAGYYGVLNHYFTSTPSRPVPVDLLITGTVPAGSGLSSSAAMVVASTLAFLAVNGKLDEQTDRDNLGRVEAAMNKGKLVQMTMENEKRVGVNSGGMDQAASVMSLPSSALYVAFHPGLTAQSIPLPSHAVFVCANSLVVSDKVVHARTRYNLRVVETLVGARVLGRKLGVSMSRTEKVTLREVVGRFGGEVGGDGGREMDAEGLRGVLQKIERELEGLKEKNDGLDFAGVNMEEMIEFSGLDEETFRQIYLSWVDVDAVHFQLYKRARHVISEALRVLQFREICVLTASSASKSSSNDSVLKELGKLMNDSQESCARLFECSCPELDELTSIARNAGAYGSRLTGAGWGGCTVSLVAEGRVDSFIAKVKAAYAPYRELEGDALHEVIFATRQSSGACLYKVE